MNINNDYLQGSWNIRKKITLHHSKNSLSSISIINNTKPFGKFNKEGTKDRNPYLNNNSENITYGSKKQQIRRLMKLNVITSSKSRVPFNKKRASLPSSSQLLKYNLQSFLKIKRIKSKLNENTSGILNFPVISTLKKTQHKFISRSHSQSQNDTLISQNKNQNHNNILSKMIKQVNKIANRNSSVIQNTRKDNTTQRIIINIKKSIAATKHVMNNKNIYSRCSIYDDYEENSLQKICNLSAKNFMNLVNFTKPKPNMNTKTCTTVLSVVNVIRELPQVNLIEKESSDLHKRLNVLQNEPIVLYPKIELLKERFFTIKFAKPNIMFVGHWMNDLLRRPVIKL